MLSSGSSGHCVSSLAASAPCASSTPASTSIHMTLRSLDALIRPFAWPRVASPVGGLRGRLGMGLEGPAATPPNRRDVGAEPRWTAALGPPCMSIDELMNPLDVFRLLDQHLRLAMKH